MNITDMSYEDFLKLPHRKWDEEIECNSIVIIPLKINLLEMIWYNIRNILANYISIFKNPEIYEINGMHDSGYRTMDFAAIKNEQPICLLSGRSDVIHIDGIGGFGYHWYEKCGKPPNTIRVSGWNIDCLPRSGLLRLWPSSSKVICAPALSSFEIYAIK